MINNVNFNITLLDDCQVLIITYEAKMSIPTAK